MSMLFMTSEADTYFIAKADKSVELVRIPWIKEYERLEAIQFYSEYWPILLFRENGLVLMTKDSFTKI